MRNFVTPVILALWSVTDTAVLGCLLAALLWP
jgi:hypothetical protein